MYAELKQKTCTKCNETKTVSHFRFRISKGGNRKSHYESYCKECEKADFKVWAGKNKVKLKEKDFARNLKAKFNMSVDEYERRKASQNGGCAICQSPVSLSGRALAVDHCHKTLSIRGLLCNECNTAIGLLKENLTIVRSAFKYIRKFKK